MDGAAVVLFLIVAFLIYFLPTIIASRRGKRNAGSILIVNLFLGWMLVGWVVALAWAVSNDSPYHP